MSRGFTLQHHIFDAVLSKRKMSSRFLACCVVLALHLGSRPGSGQPADSAGNQQTSESALEPPPESNLDRIMRVACPTFSQVSVLEVIDSSERAFLDGLTFGEYRPESLKGAVLPFDGEGEVVGLLLISRNLGLDGGLK